MEDVAPTPPQELVDLDSYAREDPANPRNWPAWKKNAQILMVAFHSMSATFVAAGIIPAYETLAEEYGITVPQASYLTSAQVGTHIPILCLHIVVQGVLIELYLAF
jgi:hypothetical protein